MKNRPPARSGHGIKRRILVGAVVVLALVAALSLYFFSGSAAVESWAGAQLLQIGGNYIGPQMHFDRLTYVRPRTILVDHLTFSTPDPAQGGKPVVILAVRHARLELSEIPRMGQPIRFSEVILDSPEIQMVATGSAGGGWLGFAHFLKTSEPRAVQAQPPDTATSAPPAKAPVAMSKLSDWLLIRHVEINNGKFTYDPRVAGEPEVWLDGINATLNFSPANPATPGLYHLATTIARKPAFNLELEGQLNVDTFKAEAAKLEVTLDLRAENVHFLPSELQKVLLDHEVTGQLHALATGKPDLLHWQQSDLSLTVDVADARVAAGEHRLAVAAWNCQAQMAGGVASLRRTDAQLLGGEAHLTGTIPLEGPQKMAIHLTASNLRIQELLRKPGSDGKPIFAGRVDTDVSFAAPLAEWNKHSSGGGTFSVRDARIGHIPVLGTIIGEISKSLKGLSGDNAALTDTLQGRISFVGDAIHLDQFEGNSGAIGMRGTGTIAFDQRLDLRLNAGPIERLQDALGPLGNAWASLSDAVAGYRVSGTLNEPTVTVEIGK